MGLLDDIAVAPAKFRPTLADTLGLTDTAVEEQDFLSDSRRAVGKSEDLDRIVKLARRPLEDCSAARAEIIKTFALSGCDRIPREAQVRILVEARAANGGLCPVGVGHGKTWATMMLPWFIPSCRVAVLLIPPNMRAAFAKEWEAESRRWKLPNLAGSGTYYPGRPVLHVVPYSLLSSPKSSALLEEIGPDLIIADEAHKLKSRTSSGTIRFLKYFEAHPTTRLVPLSGTLSTRSIKDYDHLSKLALRENSPLPHEFHTVEEWSTAIDPPKKNAWSAPLGELRRLCNPGEKVREGFRRRLVDTKGVVATQESSVNCSLLMHRRDAVLPEKIHGMLVNMRGIDGAGYGKQNGTWERPDGEELVEATQVMATARQLACGFYYRWRYTKVDTVLHPGTDLPMSKREVVERWFAARKAWHRELRRKILEGAQNMDSPALCTRAAIRWFDGYRDPTDKRRKIPPFTKDGPLPTWPAKSWLLWREWHARVGHETEAVWEDEFLAKDAAEWARQHAGIVWFLSDAFGRKVAQLAGVPFYGGGTAASQEIIHETGKRSIVASIHAHGTGKNLQMFHKALFAELPAGGAQWEQTIGREHRPGQEADEVEFWAYQHSQDLEDTLDQAMEIAKYLQETFGPQKLLMASRDW